MVMAMVMMAVPMTMAYDDHGMAIAIVATGDGHGLLPGEHACYIPVP